MDLSALRLSHPHWLDHLESLGGLDIRLPEPTAMAGELLRLTVPHEDIGPVIAGRPEPGTPHWWLLERCVHSLVEAMGRVDRPPMFPELPQAGRYFYVHVYLAALPYTRQFHRERGISAQVSDATLADLGRNMAVHRKRHGAGGLHAPWWFQQHAVGSLYQLGRLQFARARLGETTGQAIRAEGGPGLPGEPSLAVHIPDFLGPMTPRACDESFEQARSFFPRHFPEEKPQVFTCHSWLLDDQFADHLPAGSNILSFQRRFRLLQRFDESDMLAFVYGGQAHDPELPRRTSLERIIAGHLAAGGTWYGRAGWIRV
ncbi:acyltransferase domain-containing protein [Nonomuraea sediminis]|uniref:acyltransferase domain-containing protein n=1 Tax=Nonomuraea sediminis TaxID=2835864 RepID=UPI001BDD89B5|nr:acyltransferase domain-containing protein [Nonomuraea sediminis]